MQIISPHYLVSTEEELGRKSLRDLCDLREPRWYRPYTIFTPWLTPQRDPGFAPLPLSPCIGSGVKSTWHAGDRVYRLWYTGAKASVATAGIASAAAYQLQYKITRKTRCDMLVRMCLCG